MTPVAMALESPADSCDAAVTTRSPCAPWVANLPAPSTWLTGFHVLFSFPSFPRKNHSQNLFPFSSFLIHLYPSSMVDCSSARDYFKKKSQEKPTKLCSTCQRSDGDRCRGFTPELGSVASDVNCCNGSISLSNC